MSDNIAELRKLLADASPAPWVQETEGSDIIKCPLYTVAETIDSSHDAAFIAAARNEMHNLLDLVDGYAELLEAEHAKRNEAWAAYARLSGELETARAEVAEKVAEWKVNGQFMADWVKRLKRELADAKERISAAVNVQVWTNEDGKRFVFVDDLLTALDPLAAPAVVSGTSQAAADGTCTCKWSPVQGRIWCSTCDGVTRAVAGTGEQAAPTGSACDRGECGHDHPGDCEDAASAPTPAEDEPAGGAA